jgi:hypothetical protein
MAGSLISPRQKAEMSKEADDNMAESRVVLFMKFFLEKIKKKKTIAKFLHISFAAIVN